MRGIHVPSSGPGHRNADARQGEAFIKCSRSMGARWMSPPSQIRRFRGWDTRFDGGIKLTRASAAIGGRFVLRASRRATWEGPMQLPRRQFLGLAACAAALPSAPQMARAQAYPARPVRIIVPVAAGGANDVTGRLIAQWLSERLGQQFVIENRPGAGTNVGTEAVIRSSPDGYTLLVSGSNAAINPTLFRSLNFNFIRDTAPIASIVRVPQLMQVTPSLPVKSVPEFIAYAKTNPGKIAMGSGGNGSPAHVIGEYFKLMTGTDLTHVPYRGAAPAVTDLLAGQIQVAFTELATSLGHVKSGNLRALVFCY